MAQLQIISPLKWPGFVEPTHRLSRQINPQFKYDMKESEAIVFVEDELTRMSQVSSATLSCDAMNVNSTLPTQYLSKNPGACLSINLATSRPQLCCDLWQSLAHNIYALHLALRYYRQLSEWGIGPLSLLMGGLTEAANTKESALPSGSSLTDWQVTLGLGPTATLEDANTLYRIRAKNIGESDPEKLQRLNLAIQQARQILS
jgi:hypothetical protein